MKRAMGITELLRDLLAHAEAVDLAALGEKLAVLVRRRGKVEFLVLLFLTVWMTAAFTYTQGFLFV